MWRLSQTTQRPPSDIARIADMVRARTGRDGWWEALQFDGAVTYFGTWCENKLNEYDPDAKRYRHTLEELLADDYMTPDWQIDRLATSRIAGISVEHRD